MAQVQQWRDGPCDPPLQLRQRGLIGRPSMREGAERLAGQQIVDFAGPRELRSSAVGWPEYDRLRYAKLAATLLVVAAAGTACQAAPVVDSSAPPAATSPSPSVLAPSDEATPIPSPTASAPPVLAIDSVVRAIVPDLRVREVPGFSGRVLGTLPLSAESLVVDGPVSDDGHTWYAVQAMGLPIGTGCEQPVTTDPYNCPGWFGWVAAHGKDGSPWLAAARMECGAWPEPILTDDFTYGLPYLGYLACFGAEERRVVGFYPSIPDDAGLGGACGGMPDDIAWLACNLGYEFLVADRADGYFGTPFILTVPPEIEMPARGHWIEVTGHFDDPAARRCNFGDPPQATVTLCRGRFVLTAAAPASAAR